jgi:hypothetical protein
VGFIDSVKIACVNYDDQKREEGSDGQKDIAKEWTTGVGHRRNCRENAGHDFKPLLRYLYIPCLIFQPMLSHAAKDEKTVCGWGQD